MFAALGHTWPKITNIEFPKPEEGHLVPLTKPTWLTIMWFLMGLKERSLFKLLQCSTSRVHRALKVAQFSGAVLCEIFYTIEMLKY